MQRVARWPLRAGFTTEWEGAMFRVIARSGEELATEEQRDHFETVNR